MAFKALADDFGKRFDKNHCWDAIHLIFGPPMFKRRDILHYNICLTTQMPQNLYILFFFFLNVLSFFFNIGYIAHLCYWKNINKTSFWQIKS